MTKKEFEKVDAKDIRNLSDYYININDCDGDVVPDRMFEYGELNLIRELVEKKIFAADKEYIDSLEDLINLYYNKLSGLGHIQ